MAGPAAAQLLYAVDVPARNTVLSPALSVEAELRFVAALALCIFPLIAQGQSEPQLSVRPADPAHSSLLKFLQAEEAHGPFLDYTQHYRSGGHEVWLKGTIYAAIAGVQLNGCAMHMDTLLVDHFSGKHGRKAIPDTWNRYKSTVEFILSPAIADALRVIEARPAQLQAGTYPVCPNQSACQMEWLEIQASHNELKLRRITNDVADYDGYIQDRDGTASSFRIPLSSARAGEDLIAQLRQAAETCSPNHPAHP